MFFLKLYHGSEPDLAVMDLEVSRLCIAEDYSFSALIIMSDFAPGD
jgi:hypothetical protein